MNRTELFVGAACCMVLLYITSDSGTFALLHRALCWLRALLIALRLCSVAVWESWPHYWSRGKEIVSQELRGTDTAAQ